MRGYLAQRSMSVVPTILGIVTLVFLMLRLIPGDPAAVIAGEHASKETMQALRESLGLEEPLLKQYGTYWFDLVRLDLGRSVQTGIPVTDLLKDAIPITMAVAVASVAIGTVIAVPLGTLAAYSRSRGKTSGDHALTGFAMAVDTMPVFWVAIVGVLFFSLRLGWFPVSGPVQWSDPGQLIQRLALPVIVLGLGQIASVARVTRTAVLDSLGDDYVRTARALGMGELTILFRHALRNSSLPIVTMTGLSVGRLFGGTVIIESIFSLPGMGTTLVNAINSRDYPIVQGVILVFALMFIAVNVITDIVYTRVDPRVRLG